MSSVRVYSLDLPEPMVDEYGFQPKPNARLRDRDQGEARMRPRWRSVPELLTVNWTLVTQEEFDVFHEWYERDLDVGSLDFDLPVQARGTPFDFTWYTAQFVGDYKCEVLDPFGYLVSATLLLIEELGSVRIPPGIEASIGLPFTLLARTVAPQFAATINLNFVLTAEPANPILEAILGLQFGLAWASSGAVPTSSQTRETEVGEDREIESGELRVTD